MKALIVDLSPSRVLSTKALSSIWKGAFFGPQAPLRLVELPPAKLPGARWVRVRTRLGGICGSDLHLVYLEGSLSVAAAAVPGRSPTYMGHEAVGDVVETGTGVSRVKVGDRVVMDGSNDCLSQEIDPPCRACAEGNRIVCWNAAESKGPQPVGGGWADEFVRHEASLHPVPQEMPDEEAVLLEPASNGVRAALRARPRQGERVLVIGAGTLGLMSIQALRAAEPRCDITAAVLFPRQASEAVARGADRAILGEDLVDVTARLTGARVYRGFRGNRTTVGGFDAACDCVGSASTLKKALRCVRAGGRIVLVGAGLHPMELDLTPVWYNEVDLLGMRSHGAEEWEGKRMPSYERVVTWRREGKMRLQGMVTHRFPLSQFRRALELAVAQDKERSWSIKIVFDFRS